jgi:hypothetical protein
MTFAAAFERRRPAILVSDNFEWYAILHELEIRVSNSQGA